MPCGVTPAPAVHQKPGHGKHHKPSLGTVRVGAPMEHITLDIMGPLNETERNNRYVLVIQDYFTKRVEAFPLPNEQAVTVAEVLTSEWVCRYGAPQSLHSDQGRNFESECSRKCARCSGSTKHTPHLSVRSPMGKLKGSMPLCKRSWP